MITHILFLCDRFKKNILSSDFNNTDFQVPMNKSSWLSIGYYAQSNYNISIRYHDWRMQFGLSHSQGGFCPPPLRIDGSSQSLEQIEAYYQKIALKYINLKASLLFELWSQIWCDSSILSIAHKISGKIVESEIKRCGS